MPQDGHGLASFDKLYPLPKVSFSAAKKMKISHWKLLFLFGFCKKDRVPNRIQAIFLFRFRLFLVENFITPISTMSTLSNNKRFCSKKWKMSGQTETCVFLYFVTPFSTFANNKRSYPTKSTTSRSIVIEDLKLWTDGADFPIFAHSFFRASPKKDFYRILYLYSADVMYHDVHPKEAHSRIFVTGGSVFARQMVAKKEWLLIAGAASL